MKYLHLVLISFLLYGCGDTNSDSTDNETNTQENTSTTTQNNETITANTSNTAVQNNEAAVLFERCQPCHGSEAEKNALQASDVIADYTKDEIINALNAYRDGTRNRHNMGALMSNFANKLSTYETNILADYIANFK